MTRRHRQLDPPPTPQIDADNPAVRTWLERFILADELLRHPARFLARTTHDEKTIKADPTLKPKASKIVDIDDLASVLKAILPAAGHTMTARRIQRMFAAVKGLDGLPVDELETAVQRLTDTVWPAHDHGEDGDSKWDERRQQHQDAAYAVLAEIDAAIAERLREGERDESIICTVDLDAQSLVPCHSENWTISPPRWLVAVKPDIPDCSPLRQIDMTRLPRAGGPFGVPLILLGPQVQTHNPHIAAPRPFYHLASVEALNQFGFRVWSEGRLTFLKTRATDFHDFEQLTDFEKLMKAPWVSHWQYPAPPPVPPLDGFAARALFALDALAHPTNYLRIPPAKTPLKTLLAARRIMVDEGTDELPDVRTHASKAWVARFYMPYTRDDAAEALFALANSTADAIEELEMEMRTNALRQYQRATYPQQMEPTR